MRFPFIQIKHKGRIQVKHEEFSRLIEDCNTALRNSYTFEDVLQSTKNDLQDIICEIYNKTSLSESEKHEVEKKLGYIIKNISNKLIK